MLFRLYFSDWLVQYSPMFGGNCSVSALKRKVRTPVFQIADLLAIVAGAIAGAIAFLPFVFTLKPVLDDKQNADMLKGMVSLAVSAIALLVFTLIVFVLFGEAFRMFLLGEAIGFVAFMAACAVRVAKALRDPHEVER